MSRQSMNEYRSFLTKILYKVTILTSFTTKETGTYKLNTSAFLIYLRVVYDHNFAVRIIFFDCIGTYSNTLINTYF